MKGNPLADPKALFTSKSSSALGSGATASSDSSRFLRRNPTSSPPVGSFQSPIFRRLCVTPVAEQTSPVCSVREPRFDTLGRWIRRFISTHEPPPPSCESGYCFDSAELPKCFAEVVDQIVHSDFARLELLVFNAEAQQKAAEPRLSRPVFKKVIDTLRHSERRKQLLYTLYERLDERRVDHPSIRSLWLTAPHASSRLTRFQ